MNFYKKVKSGAPEGYAFPAPHASPVMMSPVSYQGTKSTHGKLSWDTDVI